MKPSKVYILHHNEDISKQYAEFAAYSCDRVKMPYEKFEGFSVPTDPNDAWNSIGLNRKIDRINMNVILECVVSPVYGAYPEGYALYTLL